MNKYVNPWQRHLPRFPKGEYVDFEEIEGPTEVSVVKDPEEIIEAEVEESSPRLQITQSFEINEGSDFSIFSQGLFNITKSKF